MKRQYSFLKESVGRDLVGASAFSNRKTVVKQIVEKYPTPQSLAKGLQELAKGTKDPKAKEKILEISLKCSTVNAAQYPDFVEKIAGLNKLWSITGATLGAAALTAGAYWLGSRFCSAVSEQHAKRDAFNREADVYDEEYRAHRSNLPGANDPDYIGIGDGNAVRNDGTHIYPTTADAFTAGKYRDRNRAAADDAGSWKSIWDNFKGKVGSDVNNVGSKIKGIGNAIYTTSPTKAVENLQKSDLLANAGKHVKPLRKFSTQWSLPQNDGVSDDVQVAVDI